MNPNHMSPYERSLYEQLSPKELALEIIAAHLRTMNRRHVNRLVEEAGGYTLEREKLSDAFEALHSNHPQEALDVVRTLAQIEGAKRRSNMLEHSNVPETDTRLTDLVHALQGNPQFQKFL